MNKIEWPKAIKGMNVVIAVATTDTQTDICIHSFEAFQALMLKGV